MDGQWSGDASHRSTFALAPIGPHIHYGIQPGSNQCSLGFIWTLERFLASCGWGWRSLSHQSLVKIQSCLVHYHRNHFHQVHCSGKAWLCNGKYWVVTLRKPFVLHVFLVTTSNVRCCEGLAHE
ncbi:unnamed protein product [Durusdinium trenchii]|uniref:Uncharacterized protein n=1 Tax=Durusdinium trenchii TaxID=1381693 RepID=A0ABP0S1Z8_9DINO